MRAPGGTGGKEPACQRDARDAGLIPGSGWSPGGGHGDPLQCSCLENPVDRGAFWATVHGVAESWTRLKRLSTHAQTNEVFIVYKSWIVQMLISPKLIWSGCSPNQKSLQASLLKLLCWIWEFYGDEAAAVTATLKRNRVEGSHVNRTCLSRLTVKLQQGHFVS